MINWTATVLPTWLGAVLVFVGTFLGVGIGGWWGIVHQKGKFKEEFDREILRRRHDLADRGRTTERRPEHDGQPASRNGRIVVRSRQEPRPDHPSDQRL